MRALSNLSTQSVKETTQLSGVVRSRYAYKLHPLTRCHDDQPSFLSVNAIENLEQVTKTE